MCNNSVERSNTAEQGGGNVGGSTRSALSVLDPNLLPRRVTRQYAKENDQRIDSLVDAARGSETFAASRSTPNSGTVISRNQSTEPTMPSRSVTRQYASRSGLVVSDIQWFPTIDGKASQRDSGQSNDTCHGSKIPDSRDSSECLDVSEIADSQNISSSDELEPLAVYAESMFDVKDVEVTTGLTVTSVADAQFCDDTSDDSYIPPAIRTKKRRRNVVLDTDDDDDSYVSPVVRRKKQMVGMAYDSDEEGSVESKFAPAVFNKRRNRRDVVYSIEPDDDSSTDGFTAWYEAGLPQYSRHDEHSDQALTPDSDIEIEVKNKIENDDILKFDMLAMSDSEYEDDEQYDSSVDENDGEVLAEGLEDGASQGALGSAALPNPLQEAHPPSMGAYVKPIDDQYAVDANDEDWLRFKYRMSDLIRRLCLWARHGSNEEITAWFKQPSTEREVTARFRSLFCRVDIDEFIDLLLSSIPRQTGKVLGRNGLQLSDLLDLPDVPLDFSLHGSYLDVIREVQLQNVQQRPSATYSTINGTVKGLNAYDKNCTSWKLYVGSSRSERGMKDRLRTHEAVANKLKKVESRHHSFIRQDNVVPNFKLMSVWYNSLNVSEHYQDTFFWGPQLMEGLFMVYLDLVHLNWPTSGARYQTSTTAIDLITKLREDVDMPSFKTQSLNVAWSLLQGVSSSCKKGLKCANPDCQRPYHKDGVLSGNPIASNKFIYHSGPLSGMLCSYCWGYAWTYDGTWPTRKGYANGTFRNLTKYQVNDAWLANRPERRRCCNSACNVMIPEQAVLYGLAAGIRCQRCHDYAREFKREWLPLEEAPIQGECSVCDKFTDTLYSCDEEWMCRDCNMLCCCFKDGATARHDRSHGIVACCANVGCITSTHYTGSMTNLVEDIENNVWRCLTCNWFYSVMDGNGEEVSRHLTAVGRKAPAPIPHQRYNDTKCWTCEQYATPTAWYPIGNGEFQCGLCVPRCMNKYCLINPIFVRLFKDGGYDDFDFDNGDDELRALGDSVKLSDSEFVGDFCETCYNANKRLFDKGEKKNVHFFHNPGTTKPWVSYPEMKCRNENCGFIVSTLGRGQVFYINNQRYNPDAMRCQTCYKHFKSKGFDRPDRPGTNRAPSVRVCNNCGITNEHKTIQWHHIVIDVIDYSTNICHSCYCWSRRHNGEPRPEAQWNTVR